MALTVNHAIYNIKGTLQPINILKKFEMNNLVKQQKTEFTEIFTQSKNFEYIPFKDTEHISPTSLKYNS